MDLLFSIVSTCSPLQMPSISYQAGKGHCLSSMMSAESLNHGGNFLFLFFFLWSRIIFICTCITNSNYQMWSCTQRIIMYKILFKKWKTSSFTYFLVNFFLLYNVFYYRMSLLLGPPGSGKTTLLLALAGKLDSDLKVCNPSLSLLCPS